MIKFAKIKNISGGEFILKVNNLVKQAMQIQNQMKKLQDEVSNETVEASVGGGMVIATFNGAGNLVSIKIDPEVINPDEKDMLEDLINSAVNEGIKKSQDLIKDKMGAITGGFGIPGLF